MLAVLLITGCGKRPVKVATPSAPEASPPPGTTNIPAPPTQTANIPAQPQEPVTTSPREEPKVPTTPAKPLITEFGTASWYGPSFHNRPTSNGELYDMHGFTAAHRTLPFNSIVRVTHIESGRTVVVRVTDRGPFVPERIIDLSYAAARQLEIYRQGTARVKVEVLSSPADVFSGGRWAVQIGAFQDAGSAAKLKDKLERRYRSAQVLQYAGPTKQWWVRVRVRDDDRRRAEEVARDNHTPQGGIFLVRLD